MSQTKAKGSTKLGRDSIAKRLGVKLFGDQIVKNGQIIIRQRGQKYIAGENVKKGNDYTLFAVKDGFVKFTQKKITRFTGTKHRKTVVSVLDKK